MGIILDDLANGRRAFLGSIWFIYSGSYNSRVIYKPSPESYAYPGLTQKLEVISTIWQIIWPLVAFAALSYLGGSDSNQVDVATLPARHAITRTMTPIPPVTLEPTLEITPETTSEVTGEPTPALTPTRSIK